ncbi:helix-turn-helix domain-containing protein [Clostridium tertium]|uniref:helix-turn-helix domain-containing protein n=1 Tax=Clostridium tertium TaxID=1559 RepID=UPI00232F54B5|nr:helix-turn-helix domain-containing protein [Clostridium tertium]MDB1956620.1 helix-turn-helix domain-containing protein [Clostridium tertium]MDB1958491.1 helix-turn-helix domain-containing protein [Clostridium tertium]MDB1962382.1 helix-turn-helix domain-containing protein [Clostridium tertium]MDB1967672.1 helix-turn-helix domain-containing protein [Clostridium tertium]
MEELENRPRTMEEYREKYQNYRRTIEKKTCKIPEFAEMLDISMDKARRIVRIETFPKIKIGRDTRIILSKLDEWLEENIGECL